MFTNQLAKSKAINWVLCSLIGGLLILLTPAVVYAGDGGQSYEADQPQATVEIERVQADGVISAEIPTPAAQLSIPIVTRDGTADTDLCAGLITDKQNHPMTPLAQPAVGQTVIDPQFGTTIRRITDAGAGNDIVPMYSTIPAWNADESLLILYKVGGEHQLYDGHTYEFIRTLDIAPTDLEHVLWHTSNPDILFYPESRSEGSTWIEQLIQYDVRNDSKTVVRNFTNDGVTGYHFGLGGNPMFTSWDSNAFGLAVSESDSRIFTYRRDTDTIGGVVPTDNYPASPVPSPSGQLYYWEGNIYDASLNELRDLGLGNPYEHASIGTMNGRDTYFSVQFDPGSNSDIGTLIAHDMATGDYTVLVGEANGYPYPPSNTHISAIAFNQPGYVAVSIVGFDADGQTLLDNELLLVNANTGTVCRVAHHRSTTARTGYWGEPHVVISPSGTRMLFGSDWGGGDSVDTYVVELPSYDSTAAVASSLVQVENVAITDAAVVDSAVIEPATEPFSPLVQVASAAELDNGQTVEAAPVVNAAASAETPPLTTIEIGSAELLIITLATLLTIAGSIGFGWAIRSLNKSV